MVDLHIHPLSESIETTAAYLFLFRPKLLFGFYGEKLPIGRTGPWLVAARLTRLVFGIVRSLSAFETTEKTMLFPIAREFTIYLPDRSFGYVGHSIHRKPLRCSSQIFQCLGSTSIRDNPIDHWHVVDILTGTFPIKDTAV